VPVPSLGSKLRENVARVKKVGTYVSFNGKFINGLTAAANNEPLECGPKVQVFNRLDSVTVDLNWIKSVAFASKDRVSCRD